MKGIKDVAKAVRKSAASGIPVGKVCTHLQNLPFVLWFFHKLSPESDFEQAEQSNELESL